MGQVKGFVTSLEEMVRSELRQKGVKSLVKTYNVKSTKRMSEEELVQYCVKVEYENSFK